MANTVLESLRKLAREKGRLKVKQREMASAERRLIDQVGRLLAGFGYHLASSNGRAGNGARPTAAAARTLPKRLQCPNCDRRFARPLHLARHTSAMHRAKKTAGPKKATRRTRRKTKRSA
jgi:hypothetical protein